MFHRKPKRFRRRSNGRNGMPHNNQQGRIRTNQFSNGQSRGNFRSQLSAEKSFEKYTSLAKEAMSAGDKTLSENYLQHADHFMRVIEDRNKNKSFVKDNNIPGQKEESTLSDNKNIVGSEDIKNKT